MKKQIILLKPAFLKRLFSAVFTFLFISLPFVLEASPTGRTTLNERLIALWPFIISLAIFLLAILWYQSVKIKSKKTRGGRQVKGANILIVAGIIIILLVLLLAIPWFMQSRTKPGEPRNIPAVVTPQHRTEILLNVEGMTCTGCEDLIQTRVGELNGVESVVADHQKMTTHVVYDSTKVSLPEIVNAIEQAGYTVEEEEE